MKRVKNGFTLIEMLVVMVILTILIAAGGFYYRDLNIKAQARKAQEEAANFAQIINDIYKTGDFGISNNDLKAQTGIAKGSYPDTEAMKKLLPIMQTKYSDKISEKIMISDKQQINFKANADHKDVLSYPMNATEMDFKKELEKRFGQVIYRPIDDKGINPNNGQNNLCNAKDCPTAIVYYVGYDRGEYLAIPLYKLAEGIAHRL